MFKCAGCGIDLPLGTNGDHACLDEVLIKLEDAQAEVARLEKCWRSLKAESGYRVTINLFGHRCATLKDLMEGMERRCRKT